MQRLFAAAAALLLVGASAASGADVAIKTFRYQPDETIVEAGAELVVGNEDGIEHSVTADTEGADGPLFDTGLFGKGEERAITAPAEPGVYAFHCARHPSMQGTLRVE